ncbi:AAA family ATPase [Lactobacillus sp.]|uniref:AAA family ATPase n=1 Tax=Lactobacillus sp. TaxID=1591 RepID=UPI0019980208|nr:AAA family ATPase [Lactobacillus sp.]MBD5429324.1 AAA family ATPase [Lactobacillus sp.]
MQVIHAEDIKKPSALRILYGNPGLGKTSTIQYMPGKKLVFDIDGTSSVLKGLPNIDIVQVNPNSIREELPKLLQEVQENYLDDYDSFALDNISELENAVLTEYGKKGNNHGVPGIQNYQQLQFFELDLIRYMKAWNKQVLITAWETTDQYVEESSGQSFTRSYPQIRKPILMNVMGLALQVGRLSINPKSGQRGVWLAPTNSIFAKNQLDNRKACKVEELFKGENTDGKEAKNH